jgi:hypothetical protein
MSTRLTFGPAWYHLAAALTIVLFTQASAIGSASATGRPGRDRNASWHHGRSRSETFEVVEDACRNMESNWAYVAHSDKFGSPTF